ncbi:MAG: TetR/AcrR family transcriptional regulator, partial [Actinomycetota bacterium]|nr:TetR/AcrR family transcriptional regulator [Actinomycetota bacterium]
MSSPARARGPYAKTEARRAEILSTALDAFSVRGFQGSSLREIAEAVGLSQAGVLHHFSSKEALLAAVLAEKDAASASHFEGAHGVGVLEALRGVVAENLAQPGLIRLFTTLSAEAINEDHPAHGYFQIRYAAAREGIAAALAQGKKDGDVGEDVDVGMAASLLIAIMDGLQMQWLLNEEFDMLAAFDTFLSTFRARIGA